MSLKEEKAELLAFTTKILQHSVSEFVNTISKIGITGTVLTEWITTFKNEFEEFAKNIVADAKSYEDKYVKRLNANISEIKEYCISLGKPREEVDYKPTNLYGDLKKTDSILADLRTSYENSTTKLKELQYQLQELQRRLGIDIAEPTTTLSLNAKQSQLEEDIERLEHIEFVRAEEFTELKYDCESLIKKLNLEPSNKFEKYVLEGADIDFMLTERNLRKLRELHTVLNGKYSVLNTKILKAKEKLIRLWNLFEEDEDQCDSIFHTCNGNYKQFLTALNMELMRCEDINFDRMKLLITKSRAQIEELWSKCKIPEEEQLKFADFHSTKVSLDILESLNDKRLELKTLHRNNKSIYDNLEKYDKTYQKLEATMNKPVDRDRMKNRGGQLLKEEKERNLIIKKLNSLEFLIKTACKEQQLNFGKENIEQYFAKNYKQNLIKICRSPQCNLSPTQIELLASFRFTPLQSSTAHNSNVASSEINTTSYKFASRIPTIIKQNRAHTAPSRITTNFISKNKSKCSINKKKQMEKLRRNINLTNLRV